MNHKLVGRLASSLVLGYDGRSVHFEHRAYENRSEEQRAAYDRLRLDIEANGVRDPLITWNNHILIGMRRYEIILDLYGPDYLVSCCQITEDVARWESDDIDRLMLFKSELYQGREKEFMA